MELGSLVLTVLVFVSCVASRSSSALSASGLNPPKAQPSAVIMMGMEYVATKSNAKLDFQKSYFEGSYLAIKAPPSGRQSRREIATASPQPVRGRSARDSELSCETCDRTAGLGPR